MLVIEPVACADSMLSSQAARTLNGFRVLWLRIHVGFGICAVGYFGGIGPSMYVREITLLLSRFSDLAHQSLAIRSGVKLPRGSMRGQRTRTAKPRQ